MNRYSISGLIIVLITFLSVSCDDALIKIHQNYLDEGELTYLGRPDSLKAYPGAGRVKLTWYQNADPKIETTVIYWNLRQDSIVQPFNRNPRGGYQKDSVIVEGLEEGSNTFELVNKNRYDERSLFSSVQGESYGSNYLGRLRVRPVASIRMLNFNEDEKNATVRIHWNRATANCVGTIVRYKKYPSGEEVSLRVTANDTTHTRLTEVGNRLFHPDDILYLSSLYLPEGSIDTLYSAELKQQIVTYKSRSGTRTYYRLATGETLEGVNYPPYNPNPESVIKYIWTTMPQANINLMDCDRFGDSTPWTNFTSNIFRFTFNPDNTIDLSGYSGTSYSISNTGSNSWEPKTVSAFNPVTREFQMVYKSTTSVSAPIVTVIEETLVPR